MQKTNLKTKTQKTKD